MKPPGARLLIIDDDAVNLTLVNRVLQRHGYTTCCAHDGCEGLEFFEKFLPDLILTDILMPRLDGYDIVNRLRQDPRFEHVPVIMMSTLTDPEDHERAGNAGADAFLQKPVDAAELLECVQLLLAHTPSVG